MFGEEEALFSVLLCGRNVGRIDGMVCEESGRDNWGHLLCACADSPVVLALVSSRLRFFARTCFGWMDALGLEC